MSMNKLSRDTRAQILGMMVEGVSLRSISRLTGASKNTVAKLLEDAGQAFTEYQMSAFVNLPSVRIQVDEIWSFTHCKQKNVSLAKAAPEGAGDTWTWTAIDPDSKLVPVWYVGDRTADSCWVFLLDLKRRLRYADFQLTSDAFGSYKQIVFEVFGNDVNYGQVTKNYSQPGAEREARRRYSPTDCVSMSRDIITGAPDMKHISTSIVERQNLSMRMGMRRFTRLTNAFSKKVENHAHALAIYFMHYNFARLHSSIRCSPAMAAGITKELMDLGGMVDVLETWEMAQPKAARASASA
jgi:IS1 family transposase